MSLLLVLCLSKIGRTRAVLPQLLQFLLRPCPIGGLQGLPAPTIGIELQQGWSTASLSRLKRAVTRYLEQLRDDGNEALRRNFMTKMDAICGT